MKRKRRTGRKDFDQAPRKNQRTRRDNDESRDTTKSSTQSDKLSSLNDLSWYTHYPELSAASGMFPYPYRPGMQVSDGYFTNVTSKVNTDISLRIPGYMVLEWSPTVGYSTSSTDPASVVAREIYSRVRKEYSGSLDADAPDFLVYLVCLDSVFSYIGALKRVYRIISAYSPDNRTIPTELLYALGISIEWQTQLLNHRTQFWGCINQLVHMSRKLSCPVVMDYFKRHYWMNDNVYTDAATINSQMYVFRQQFFYQYASIDTPDGVPAAGANYIKTPMVNTDTSADAVEQLFHFGRALIDTLSAWDDAYTINGYLQRAYSDVPQFMVDLLAEDETFAPVYVPEVLAQIENSMTINYGSYSKLQADVSQDPKQNIVISMPTVSYSLVNNTALGFVNTKVLLNSRIDMPMAPDNIIASRLHAYLVSPAEGEPGEVMDIVAGTEIPIRWLVIAKVDGTLKEVAIMQKTSLGSTSSINQEYVLRLMEIEQFDWHPMFLLLLEGKQGPNVALAWDVHNMTVIEPDQLKQLHQVCTYSEFNAFQ